MTEIRRKQLDRLKEKAQQFYAKHGWLPQAYTHTPRPIGHVIVANHDWLNEETAHIYGGQVWRIIAKSTKEEVRRALHQIGGGFACEPSDGYFYRIEALD